jgi:hypothetical protein
MISVVSTALGLVHSESWRPPHRTYRPEWTFELGGALAVKNMGLGLMKTPEGCFFTAGLWDADGSWTRPDESHPMGQAKFFGGWHVVYWVKRNMRRLWAIGTGKMFVATRGGHTSKIGSHTIVTRNDVYGINVRAVSLQGWIDRVGKFMILKSRLPFLPN